MPSRSRRRSAYSRVRSAASATVVCRVDSLGHLDVEARCADLGLELARSTLGDLPTVIDDGDPPGECVGFVEVLGGQHDGRSLGDQAADRVPHLAAVPGVETGRGLSRKSRAGLVIRLAARSRRRRMPPENWEMGR